jgi:AhpD family alkylhydroperoxidase
MLDWNQYRQQILAGVGDLAKLSPDTVKGYVSLGGAGAKTARLDARTRELIALAVAVTVRCDGCISVHADQARKLGLTREEIAEAILAPRPAGLWHRAQLASTRSKPRPTLRNRPSRRGVRWAPWRTFPTTARVTPGVEPSAGQGAAGSWPRISPDG